MKQQIPKAVKPKPKKGNILVRLIKQIGIIIIEIFNIKNKQK